MVYTNLYQLQTPLGAIIFTQSSLRMANVFKGGGKCIAKFRITCRENKSKIMTVKTSWYYSPMALQQIYFKLHDDPNSFNTH